METIAAIATSTVGQGSIGIIRVSGDNSIEIVDKLFVSKSRILLENLPSYKAVYGNIVDNSGANVDIIDQVIILLMRGPKSYTTEDVVEIQCHGGAYVLRRILELILKSGARLAEPGEFTKRAFLGGRIDLTQAEAVMDLIASKNETTRKAANNQLQGRMGERIRSIRGEILEMTALIEAALDDPEHYDIDEYQEVIHKKVDNLVDILDKLWISVDNGHIFKEGIGTAILGKPNAGKSSILNLLSGRERSIVTDIEGTTRDIIEEQINLGGILLNLFDTAGIRNSEDIVENIGVNRARECANNADLILYVVDSSRSLDANDKEILDMIKNKNTIVLINKTDLDSALTSTDLEFLEDKKMIHISAKTGEGLDELTDQIMDMFMTMDRSSSDDIYFANIRQKEYLKKSLESMKLVKESIDLGMPEDCLTIDLLDAYDNLGFITGESTSDDLVNEIFSKFCMGK